MKNVQKTLNEFAEKYNLEEETKKSCLVYIKNWVRDDGEDALGGFSMDEIRLEFVRHNLIFWHWTGRDMYIKTRIGIYKTEEDDAYFRNLEMIGTYDLGVNMDGEHFDDWLSMDEEKKK